MLHETEIYRRTANLYLGDESVGTTTYERAAVSLFEDPSSFRSPPRAVDASAAFGELDLQRSDDASLKLAIRSLHNSPAVWCAQQLAAEIEEVAEDFKVENDGKALDANSVAAFEVFLRNAPALRLPTLAATPDGCLYAAWRGQQGRLLSAMFQGGGIAKYVVFAPAPQHAGVISRNFGSTPARSLGALVSALGALEWARR